MPLEIQVSLGTCVATVYQPSSMKQALISRKWEIDFNGEETWTI